VEDARRLEPALGREARAAALLPDEACLDNRALTGAVLAAAENAGAKLLTNTKVTRLVSEGTRCVGVAAGGRTIAAGNVILAAGAFCNGIEGVVPTAAVKPARGQMAALRNGAAQLRRVLRSDRAYVVPRDDARPQRLVAGSTVEDAGFEKCVTPRGLEKIFSALLELAPSLAGAEVVDTWSGLRPDTPDHLPLLGPGELEGLTFATGHYRNGILLTPITAKLVREWVTERRVSLDWERFSPLRFGAEERREPPPRFSAKTQG
jgi:glycine oxidase